MIPMSKLNPFNIGDRVRFYDATTQEVFTVQSFNYRPLGLEYAPHVRLMAVKQENPCLSIEANIEYFKKVRKEK